MKMLTKICLSSYSSQFLENYSKSLLQKIWGGKPLFAEFDTVVIFENRTPDRIQYLIMYMKAIPIHFSVKFFKCRFKLRLPLPIRTQLLRIQHTGTSGIVPSQNRVSQYLTLQCCFHGSSRMTGRITVPILPGSLGFSWITGILPGAIFAN